MRYKTKYNPIKKLKRKCVYCKKIAIAVKQGKYVCSSCLNKLRAGIVVSLILFILTLNFVVAINNPFAPPNAKTDYPSYTEIINQETSNKTTAEKEADRIRNNYQIAKLKGKISENTTLQEYKQQQNPTQQQTQQQTELRIDSAWLFFLIVPVLFMIYFIIKLKRDNDL